MTFIRVSPARQDTVPVILYPTIIHLYSRAHNHFAKAGWRIRVLSYLRLFSTSGCHRYDQIDPVHKTNSAVHVIRHTFFRDDQSLTQWAKPDHECECPQRDLNPRYRFRRPMYSPDYTIGANELREI